MGRKKETTQQHYIWFTTCEQIQISIPWKDLRVGLYVLTLALGHHCNYAYNTQSKLKEDYVRSPSLIGRCCVFRHNTQGSPWHELQFGGFNAAPNQSDVIPASGRAHNAPRHNGLLPIFTPSDGKCLMLINSISSHYNVLLACFFMHK